MHFLGHIIEVEGVLLIDPQKIIIIVDWPRKATIKWFVLGIFGYYRKFVEEYFKNSWHSYKINLKSSVLWMESKNNSNV